MKETKADVVVIGAGITGLVTAYNLMEAGKKVVLLEKNDVTGGQIKTILENGFVFESGPNTGVINNPDVIRLFESLEKRIQPETACEESKIRLIWKGKSFHALPNGFKTGLTTPLFTFRDKLRICLEPWRKKGRDPMESIGALSRRRLGKSFFQYAIDPFVSGVYAGDPDRLVTRFALPKLYNLEQNYGSFIRGAIQLHKTPKTTNEKKVSKQVFSVPNGFGKLTEALTEAIAMENIRLSIGQATIMPIEGDYSWKTSLQNEILLSKYVISTVPAYALEELLPFIGMDLKTITYMPYAPVIQVGVGIRTEAWRIPIAFGGLIPSCERKDILGILFPSSCFNKRAPKDGATLSFFLGGSKRREILCWEDEKIINTVERALTEMLGFPKGYKPEVMRIFRHERAIPQYEADSQARLDTIQFLQALYPGLYLAGSIRDGIGLSDRIKQGADLATLIVESK